MKKITIFALCSVLIVGGLWYYKTHTLSSQNMKVEQSLNAYEKDKNREEQLKRLQDPTILQTQLNKVGKVTSLCGNYNYFSKIEDKDGLFNKFVLRDMTLEFNYSFGIGTDLSNIRVTDIKGTTVYLDVPRNKMKLQYIEMNPESKITDSHKVILVSQFSPQDIETVTEQSQQNVVDKINSDNGLFDKAQVNLEDDIKNLVLNFGYYKCVVFNAV